MNKDHWNGKISSAQIAWAHDYLNEIGAIAHLKMNASGDKSKEELNEIFKKLKNDELGKALLTKLKNKWRQQFVGKRKTIEVTLESLKMIDEVIAKAAEKSHKFLSRKDVLEDLILNAGSNIISLIELENTKNIVDSSEEA